MSVQMTVAVASTQSTGPLLNAKIEFSIRGTEMTVGAEMGAELSTKTQLSRNAPRSSKTPPSLPKKTHESSSCPPSQTRTIANSSFWMNVQPLKTMPPWL